MFYNVNPNDTNNNTCNPCPVQPIVCPERVNVVHCCKKYNQPIIVPVRTHIITHYSPKYCYEVVRTTTEETKCHDDKPCCR